MLNDLENALRPGDALIIVDVQKDFCPGGALPIQRGDEVVAVLNRWIAAAVAKHVPLYASRDWHPIGHISFSERGGPWPPHCIQDSEGAQYHSGLQLPDSVIKVTKGVRFDQDQNSVFDQTGLAYQCVLASVLDARRENFEVVLIENATRPVSADGGEQARRQMREAGARFENAG